VFNPSGGGSHRPDLNDRRRAESLPPAHGGRVEQPQASVTFWLCTSGSTVVTPYAAMRAVWCSATSAAVMGRTPNGVRAPPGTGTRPEQPHTHDPRRPADSWSRCTREAGRLVVEIVVNGHARQRQLARTCAQPAPPTASAGVPAATPNSNPGRRSPPPKPTWLRDTRPKMSYPALLPTFSMPGPCTAPTSCHINDPISSVLWCSSHPLLLSVGRLQGGVLCSHSTVVLGHLFPDPHLIVVKKCRVS
jgi:hypothetical protein